MLPQRTYQANKFWCWSVPPERLVRLTHRHEKRLQRQQTIPARQALRGVRPHHNLVQGLGQELGLGVVLLGCLQNQKK